MESKKRNKISWGNDTTLTQQALNALYNIRKDKG